MSADIDAIARKTIDTPNADAWPEILRLLNGRVAGSAITDVRVKVWALRKALIRERKAAAAAAAAREAASGAGVSPSLP
jgi:hypothetical protein